jgi:hypothetical protein
MYGHILNATYHRRGGRWLRGNWRAGVKSRSGGSITVLWTPVLREMPPGMQVGQLASGSAQIAASLFGPLALQPTTRSDVGEGKPATLVPTKTLTHSVVTASLAKCH